jgi:CRISPR-associated protein Csm3
MEIKNITSSLKIVTGLHIGGGDDSMKIGGVDSPVLKREVFSDKDGNISFPKFDDKGNITNGLTKITEPYIAGSSLKGKVRSLLEHYFRLINYLEQDKEKRGAVVDSKTDFEGMDKNKRDLIVKLFGESAGKDKSANITRLIFRDCFITTDVRKASINNKIELSEVKYENVINRITGTTKDGGLRQIERVPSGVEFDFDISIRYFEEDNKELFENTLKLGLKLLELDVLGGSGSRGYGKVLFDKFKDEDLKKLSEEIEKDLKNETNKN